MNTYVYQRMTNIKSYVYECIGTITINTSLDNPIILLRYQATLPYQDNCSRFEPRLKRFTHLRDYSLTSSYTIMELCKTLFFPDHIRPTCEE